MSTSRLLTSPGTAHAPRPSTLSDNLGDAKSTIRVLIADDHPVVCLGLLAIVNLQPDMTVVGQATNGLEAIEMTRQYSPKVVLIDLRMSKMKGVEAITAQGTVKWHINIILRHLGVTDRTQAGRRSCCSTRHC